MGRFANETELQRLSEGLNRAGALPNTNPERHHVVYWHVFRSREETLDFARRIMLEDGEDLVGGRAQDSIGALWWVGVRVDDLESWGNRRAIQKTDPFGPESPDSPML